MAVFCFSQVNAMQFELPGASAETDNKGFEVAIEGNLAAVAAYTGTVEDISSGYVYLYEFDGTQWQLITTLLADDRGDGDLFGEEIEIFQNRIFISADSATQIVGGVEKIKAGAVYVFEKVSDEWVQTTKIVANEINDNDYFGEAIFADSNRLFISKGQFTLNTNDRQGSIHVYEYIDQSWVETSSIINDQGVIDHFSFFGEWDIHVSDDTLVAPLIISSTDTSYGTVKIYQLIDNEWQLQQSISSPFPEEVDFFGFSSSIIGNRLLIADHSENGENGAVYLYEKVEGVWTLQERFSSANDAAFTQYGIDVVLGDDQFFVGSQFESNVGPSGHAVGEGRVFVYNLVDNSWQLNETLQADGDKGLNRFGRSLDLDYDQLIVGASGFFQSGDAYVFDIEPNSTRLSINQGLNGAWFNPETSGQGLFLDVSPSTDFSFLGWFTYDTELALDDDFGQIGADGHRWLVGAGDINQSNSSIDYELYYAYDGKFDNSREVLLTNNEYGSLNITFESCSTALVTYELFGQGISGSYPVNRPVAESGTLCEEFATEPVTVGQSDGGFDYGLNGAWFNPDTPGQGIFIDNFKGVDNAFMGWFTFDTTLQPPNEVLSIGSPGQRWLVGDGGVDATNSNVLNYQLYYTHGGLFDDPVDVTLAEPETFGSLRIEFVDCANANVEYGISGEDLSGSFSMIRAIPNGVNCVFDFD